MNKGTAIVGFFLCFLAGMALMYGYEHERGGREVAVAESGPVNHASAAIPVDPEDDPVWGSVSAPVTIVEISDFECPFCGRVNPTLKQVKENYGPEKVRIVWKHNPLPFHKNARGAHEAAVAVFEAAGGGKAGSDAFWKFHDLAFANQRELTPEKLEAWAVQAGANPAKYKELVKSPEVKAKVDKDLAMARKIGARGTPNFRINGIEVSGAQPYTKFKEIIDKEYAEGKRLMGSGTPAAQVYLERLEKNFGKQPEADDEKPERKRPQEDDTTVWRVPVHPDDPIKGAADALVTVVLFSDFQCPFCSRVNPTVEQILSTYKDDVRVVWKDNALPFHPRAKPAANLARIAYEQKGDKGFWQAHDLLFAAQKDKLTDEALEGVSKQLGIAWGTVKKAIDEDGDKYDKKIDQSMEEASDLNARGTPHFFVNGMRLSGAQPFEKFKELIDGRLAEAKKLVAAGTPRAQVYAKLMETAKGPPPPETKEVPKPTAANPSKGAANPKVVIQQFSDFQCPFCGRVEPTIDQIEKEYGDRVKIVWRNLPLAFHQDAPLAAEASLEAFAQKGNAGFWKFHKALFANQKEPDGIKRPGLEKIAQEQGLDMAKFKEALDSGKHKKAVEADKKVAEQANVSGTPGFVINNYWLSGAQPYPAFKKLIDRALKEAK